MPKVRVYDGKGFYKELPCRQEALDQTIFLTMQMYGDEYWVDVEEDNGECWSPI